MVYCSAGHSCCGDVPVMITACQRGPNAPVLRPPELAREPLGDPSMKSTLRQADFPELVVRLPGVHMGPMAPAGLLSGPREAHLRGDK